MKTKHILTALALPALFAACTAEGVVNEGTVALQERPTVQNLTVRVVEGAESRYAVNGTSSLKFNFETGDKFGAAIIDEYQPGVKPENWEVIPSLAGNTPFTYNSSADEWSAPEDLPMGLGHYLFVYPYNRADVNRAAVSYELPAVQKLYTEEDGEIDLNAAIEAGNKSFYSTVVTSPYVEDLDIDLKNLYAYPKFVINFDNGEKVTTVSKVVLAKKGGFEVKGGFNHEVVAALFADNADEKFWTSKEVGKEDKTTNWDLVQTADLLTSDKNYATIETSDYLVAELPTDAKVQEVTNNKVIEVRFMIPGVQMESTSEFDNYDMYIYTNNGVYVVNEGNGLGAAISWKTTTKDAAKKRAFARGTANTITINKKYVEVADDAKYIVTNIAEWNELVEEFGSAKNHEVNVEVVGLLTLDETAEMPSKATFNVKNLAVEGEVELCNVNVEETLNVNKGATLTTCATLSATYIVNEGEVVIAPVYNSKGNADNYEGIMAIDNYGTLTVAEEAIAEFGLANREDAVVDNKGEITIMDLYGLATEDVVQTNGGNEGTINNAGTIELNYFTNLEPRKNERTGDIENLPTINNDGKILAIGTFVNDGMIVNDGTMTCRHINGEIENNYKIDSKKGAVTYITDNKDGEIIVYEIDLSDYVTVENKNGVISYEAKGTVDFKLSDTKTSIVNKVVVVGDLTIKNLGNVKTVDVEADAELAIEKGTLTSLNVYESVEVASNITTADLKVEEDALVHINADKALNVTYSLTNEGVIEAYGVLDLSRAKIEKGDEVGKIEENGAKGEVRYYDPTADELQAAWNRAVTEWTKEGRTNDGWYYWWMTNNSDWSKYYAGNPYDYVAFWNTAEAWTNNNVISALVANYGEQLPYSDSDKDGKIDVPVQFVNAVNKLLSDREEDAEAYLKDKDGKWLTSILEIWRDQKIALCYENMEAVEDAVSQALNTPGAINTFFGEKPVMAAYTWYVKEDLASAIIEAYPYAYVWEGCTFHNLVSTWVKYAHVNTGENDYAASCADIETLIAWVADVLNADKDKSPAIGEIQRAIANIGVTAGNYIDFKEYSTPQVQACCGANQTSARALTGSLK